MPTPNRSSKRTIAIALALCGLAICLAACTPQDKETPKASPDEAASTPVEFTWSKESDCTSCHKENVNSFSDTACGASQHVSLQADCLTCHDDAAGLKDAHKKVTLDSKKKKATLKKTEVKEDICLTCHDKAELAAATKTSSALTDKNGLTVNPHDIPVNDDHAKAGPTCSSCHRLHTAESATETALAACRNCHHADVYECNTCHAKK